MFYHPSKFNSMSKPNQTSNQNFPTPFLQESVQKTYIVFFAAVIRVVTQRSSALTAAHSSSAFLSLCYWEPITWMYLSAARQSYFSSHLPPKTRFLEYGSLLLIGQFEERNAELERAAVSREDRCVTTLITAAKKTRRHSDIDRVLPLKSNPKRTWLVTLCTLRNLNCFLCYWIGCNNYLVWSRKPPINSRHFQGCWLMTMACKCSKLRLKKKMRTIAVQ